MEPMGEISYSWRGFGFWRGRSCSSGRLCVCVCERESLSLFLCLFKLLIRYMIVS